MGKKRTPYTREQVKAFRHHVSVLKAKGLVSKRVDARKQRPTRYMTNKVKQLAPILHGEAVGVKVKPSLLKQYKEAGFNIVNRRVIVEKTPEEISRTRKGLPLMRRHLGGSFVQERLVLPFSPRNIDSLFERVQNDPNAFNGLKERGDLFAFKIYGNNSLATFEDFELLVEYLSRYEAVHTRADAWTHLQFFRVAPGAWKPTKRERASTVQDRRGRARKRGVLKGERIYKAEEAERKRVKRATDAAWADKTRAKDRARKAEKRAANPEWNKAARLKEALRKRDRRKQANADKRNGYSD